MGRSNWKIVQAILARTAISTLLQGIGCSTNNIIGDPDGVLEKRLRERVASCDLATLPLTRLDAYIRNAVYLMSSAYGHTPADCQLHLAVYCILCFIVDDLFVPPTALAEFMQRLYFGSKQLHPVLDLFVENLRGMHEYYTPFATSRIIKSTVDFIESVVLDSQIEATKLKSTTLSFATFRRLNSGIGEAFAAFIFDKVNFPDFHRIFKRSRECPSCISLNTATDWTPSRDMNMFCDFVKYGLFCPDRFTKLTGSCRYIQRHLFFL